MDLNEIKAIIPHRDPFLWVDEVVECTENSIHAKKTIAENLPIFQGHYPGNPILPGVILCEMAMQAGAILIGKMHLNEETENRVPVATRLNNVKFRQIVRPGETVEIHAEITETLKGAYFLNGKIISNGKVATRLEFAVTNASM